MAYRKTEFVERKRLETRARIVEAATALVRSGGWRSCVLKAVARNAGVSTGSLYTHFRKVSDLYIEVFHAIAERELAVIAEIAEREDPPADRLAAAVDAFTRRALRGPVKAQAVIGEPVAPEVEVVRQSYRRRFAEQFELIIRDGAKAGDFVCAEPRHAATCMLGALNEAMIAPLARDPAPTPSQARRLQAAVRDFCLRAVGAGDQRDRSTTCMGETG